MTRITDVREILRIEDPGRLGPCCKAKQCSCEIHEHFDDASHAHRVLSTIVYPLRKYRGGALSNYMRTLH